MSGVQITVRQAQRHIASARRAWRVWQRTAWPEYRHAARQNLETARLLLALVDWEMAHE